MIPKPGVPPPPHTPKQSMNTSVNKSKHLRFQMVLTKAGDAAWVGD